CKAGAAFTARGASTASGGCPGGVFRGSSPAGRAGSRSCVESRAGGPGALPERVRGDAVAAAQDGAEGKAPIGSLQRRFPEEAPARSPRDGGLPQAASLQREQARQVRRIGARRGAGASASCSSRSCAGVARLPAARQLLTAPVRATARGRGA